MRIFTSAALAFLAAAPVSAISLWSVTIWNSRTDTTNSAAIRIPTSRTPVKDLTSPDLLCGPGGNTAASSYLPVQISDEFNFEFYNRTHGDDPIAAEDKGVFVVYMAPAETNGIGPVWTKISDWGRGWTKPVQWATEDVRAPHYNAKVIMYLPLVPKGKYLLRTEWIVLRDAAVSYQEDPEKGAEFWPTCVQIEILETGYSGVPPAPGKLEFPGAYKYDDAGILFDLEDPKWKTQRYPTPGGELWDKADCNGPGQF